MVIPTLLNCLLATQILSLSLSDQKEFHLSPSDHLHFGKYWSEIKTFAAEGYLDHLIHKRQSDIEAINEAWRLPIKTHLTQENPSFYRALDECLLQGQLVPIEEGLGGTYLLVDQKGTICFVIKPLDEDILCLNNNKHHATPFYNSLTRVRAHIPLYRSCQTCAAASALATSIGLKTITPQTCLAIISHEQFYHRTPFRSQEKLCSVQEYLQESEELYDKIKAFIEQGVSDEGIGALLDQDDFEQANIFVWLCFDNDAHAGNFRTYRKENGLLGLKKIDNNLTFPEENKGLSNCLHFFPNAEMPISEAGKSLINRVSVPELIDILRFYGLNTSIQALTERIHILKQLIQEPITLKAINTHLSEL